MTAHARKRQTKVAYPPKRAPPTLLYELEAEAIKALANPKRLLILDLLSDGEERNVTNLMDETGFRQSNLSQNLAVMRMAGLLASRREGHLVYYRVADPRVVKAVGLMRSAMAEQVESYQFLAERAALQKRQRVKRASLGASIVVAALTAIALAGALHPLVNGGSFTDVEHHVQLMAASKDLGALFQTCVDVATQATQATPTASASPAMAA